MYKNPTANNMFNNETLNFLLKARTRQECLLVPILFNIVQNTLAKARNEIESIQIEKEEAKLSLFADNMILYTETSKEFTEKLLEQRGSTILQGTQTVSK